MRELVLCYFLCWYEGYFRKIQMGKCQTHRGHQQRKTGDKERLKEAL